MVVGPASSCMSLKVRPCQSQRCLYQHPEKIEKSSRLRRAEEKTAADCQETSLTPNCHSRSDGQYFSYNSFPRIRVIFFSAQCQKAGVLPAIYVCHLTVESGSDASWGVMDTAASRVYLAWAQLQLHEEEALLCDTS